MSNVSQDERISAEVSTQVGIAAGGGVDFVSAEQIAVAAQEAGLADAEIAALGPVIEEIEELRNSKGKPLNN